MKTTFFALTVLILTAWSCKVQESQGNCPSDLSMQELNSGLIRDCPEVLIRNKMPQPGEPKIPEEYYIYKGRRRELKEFDSLWVRKHCTVKTMVAE